MATAVAPSGRVLSISWRPSRGMLAATTVAVWVLAWAALRGRDTLFLSPADLTPLHR